MADIFRILDRFHLAGTGTVFIIRIYMHQKLFIGDILYDLKGNRFKIKGFDMFRQITDDAGITFELIDGIEPEGNLLVRNPENISFIFCSHPLYPNRVDEEYAKEYQSAGLDHACALFSYEDLETGRLSMYGEEISGLTVYRGWMMTPDLYKVFYEKLEEKGIILINTPEEYERYHILSGWYRDFEDVTPKSVWEDQGTIDSAMQLTKGLTGPYIVKDYVKSRKHEWYDACFIYNIANKANAEKVIRNFIDRQGSGLAGGIVLRQFVKFKPIGFHEKSGMPISEEYRVFVFAGRIMVLGNYWQTDQKICFTDDECAWIEMCAKRIKSNFVTMDIARCEDDSLMIIELGDGQVSGLQQIQPEEFYRAFYPKTLRLDDRPAEDYPKEAVILARDPFSDVSAEEMKKRIPGISSVQELVDAYVRVHNHFWYIEDDLYDYETWTAEYAQLRAEVDAWFAMLNELNQQVMEAAEKEGLLAARQPDSGTAKQLEAFMAKYGYRDGRGWWVKIKK